MMDYMRRSRPAFQQPCDSFFIEEDCRALFERQAKEEEAKWVAAERQYAIAEQLSSLASEELRDDVLNHMLEMDVSSDHPLAPSTSH